MRPIQPHQLVSNRRAQAHHSFSGVELHAAYERTLAAERTAHEVLKDAIKATGLTAFPAAAVLAAASSYAKAKAAVLVGAVARGGTYAVEGQPRTTQAPAAAQLRLWCPDDTASLAPDPAPAPDGDGNVAGAA